MAALPKLSALDQQVKNLMVSGGWPPDPDWTVVVPFASVTVNVTFNAVSVPPTVDPDPPQVCVNVKFGLVPLWLCETRAPYW